MGKVDVEVVRCQEVLHIRPDQTRLDTMKIVNVQQAKTHLSRLLEEAVAGEDIVISKAGRPYARLTPCPPDRSPRILGGWEGKVQIAPGFDDEDEAIIRLFEGGKGRALGARRPRGTRKKTARRRS